jgi:TonB family protein
LPPAPPAQPLPNNQESKLEAPKAAPTKPNFQTAQPSNLSQDLQQLARNSRSGQYNGGGGDLGAGAPSQHSGLNGAVDVLSDTMGVDFGPYIQRVIFDTKRAWYPIIPEAARPPLNKQGRVAIRFHILPDGSVKEMILEGPSGDVSLDRAAWGGITGASPYPPLPKEFKGKDLELRFFFLYNLEPGQ